MEQYKIEVVRTDEYVIEVDDAIWNKQALEDWSRFFCPIYDTLELANSLSIAVMQNGSGRTMDGFGNIKTFFKSGNLKTQFKWVDENFVPVKEEEYTKGLKIKIISENRDFESNLLEE